MIFNEPLIGNDIEPEDTILNSVDPDSAEGEDAIANTVEQLMQQAALENAVFFNGEENVREFCESAEMQTLNEARKMSKKTYVIMGRNDDLTRRSHLAALVIAKEKNDPLFKRLAMNRVMERKLRAAIFKKYGNKSKIIAKKSQKQHVKALRKMPPIKPIKLV